MKVQANRFFDVVRSCWWWAAAGVACLSWAALATEPNRVGDSGTQVHAAGSEPNSPAVEPNEPNVPAGQADPNAALTAVSIETRSRILSRSVSAVAASNWITQSRELPAVPAKESIKMVAYSYPYWEYRHKVMWDDWYNDDFLNPYQQYPAGEGFYNHAGVRMGVNAGVSVELGTWTLY